jgi:glycerophosphoryl diester phosphodiesterase
LAALRSALQLGVTHVEFDVHLSADLVPVLMHDSNLKRCAGIDGDALALTWAELATHSVHEPARFGDRFKPTAIPSLQQAVELLREYPQAKAFVELKRTTLRRHGAEVVLQHVYEQLKPISQQVVIISFDLHTVKLARELLKLPIGWVLPEYSTMTAIKAEASLPDYLFCNQDKLPPDGARLWRGPWRWVIYEVATQTQADALLARGAHLLETMQVRKLVQQAIPA